MLAVPPLVFAVGVKVAVRVKPLPLIVPSVPPVVTTSASVKVAPGSSLKVKVIAAVSPILSVDTSLVIASVGAVVSTLTTSALEAVPVLPAASVAVAVIECAPVPSVELTIDQFPPVATAVPSTVVPSYSVTVAPASAVPVNVGVVTLVRLSVLDVPASLAAARSGVLGAVGASVSNVSEGVVPAPPLLPAASV